MQFKLWLENQDRSGYYDPDDIYYNRDSFTDNHSGITFVYNPKTNELKFTKASNTHSYIGGQNPNEGLLAGRTYNKSEVAFWSNNIFPNERYAYQNDGLGHKRLQMCLDKLIQEKFLYPKARVYVNSEDWGFANKLNPNFDAIFTPSTEVSVPGIPYKMQLNSLPAYLHVLPETSPEKTAIKNFICSHTDDYPFLKKFQNRAGCNLQNKPSDKSFKNWILQRMKPEDIQGLPKRTIDSMWDAALQK